jgi:hypothetical protein
LSTPQQSIDKTEGCSEMIVREKTNRKEDV